MREALIKADSEFLANLRAVAIFIIVFGHVGGFWFYRPYSEFLHVFVPVFFFISGAVTYFSFLRSHSLMEFYSKRILGLLVPYYLVCLLSVVVYVVLHGSVPVFNFDKLLEWLEIRPSGSIMVFPLGQVWFLNTLLIITIFAPLYFYLLKRKSILLLVLLGTMVCASIMQHFIDLGHNLYLFGNNIFKPIVHSTFYILGAVCFSGRFVINKKFYIIASIFLFICEVVMIVFFIGNSDYSFHTFAPDFYYLVGSLFAICFFMVFKNLWNAILKSSDYLKMGADFFYRHTFSIFLLHSFSIFLAEKYLGLVGHGSFSVKYGIIKLFVVLMLTSFMAVPFSYVSKRVVSLSCNVLF
jgi:peptidoglycan/LPS O-acetylase OafA/YrhL